MRIGEAVRRITGAIPDELEPVLVRPEGGRFAHYRLEELADAELNGDELYIASGLFIAGKITRWEGRKAENLGQILWLPFDFDLSDWLSWEKETVYTLTTTVLEPLVGGLRETVEGVFATIGLPIHLLISTGHGLCACVRVAPHPRERVPDLRTLHKALVERINSLAGFGLADTQVNDAGTRIVRVPASWNRKGAEPRPVRLLFQRDGEITEAELRTLIARLPTRRTAGEGHTAELPDAEVAAIVDAVRPHWTAGTRHLLALGIAGMLAKAGVSESTATAIVDALAADDPEREDRLRAVRTTYARTRAGASTAGYSALAALLPAGLSGWLDARLERVRLATSPRIVIGATRPASGTETHDDRSAAPAFEELPDLCLQGWIADYVRLMEPTTEAPRAFHYGVGITIAGATIGRRVGVAYGADPLYPNLYTLLIGRSGRSRKDTAIKRGTRLVTEPLNTGTRVVNADLRVITDVGSAEGLIQALNDSPNILLYLTEFSRLIGQARRKGTATIIPVLIEAFDTPPVLSNLTKANPIEARYPFLSIVSATQPDILAALMADEDVHSGFANRWFYVCGEGRGPLAMPPHLDRPAVERLSLELWNATRSYEPGVLLQLDRQARDRWHAWYDADYRQTPGTAEEDAMRVRHAVLIQKLATIHAVSSGAAAIGLAHLEPAIAAIDWMWRHVSRLLPTWGGRIDTLIEERMVAVLARRGQLRRRDLQMQCGSRRWSGTDFARVFDAAVKNGRITVDPFGFVALNEEE